VSGHEDIRTLASRLEDLYEELRDDSRSIDQTVEKVTEAIALYKTFKKFFAESEFDVKILQRSGAGEAVEMPFDWKALS
jgi:hypothetical protein